MAIEPNPQQLKELFVLLSDRKLHDKEVAPMVDRALLALDDPATYINDYPDDEWLVEGFDVNASLDGSLRLLHWVLFDELQPFLSYGDKTEEIVERVVDRLIESGIAVADPPAHLRTLNDYRGYLNEQLAVIKYEQEPKQLVEFDTGLIDDIGFFVVRKTDVPRIANLARAYRLRINADVKV